MNITLNDVSLERYQDFVLSIYQKYLDSLNNKFLFLAKCYQLVVSINLAEVFPISSGYFQKGPEISLSICPEDPDEYVAFIIAHEFAHLLFDKVDDVLLVSGRASDESIDYSAIQRADEEGNTYGLALEEACADAVAKWIVSDMGFENPSHRPLRRLDGSKEGAELVRKLSRCFGSPLEEHSKIDAFFIDKEHHYSYIQNCFWYAIITFSFSEIIDEYDGFMGKGAFKRFCELFDEYEKKRNSNVYRLLHDAVKVFYDRKEEKEKIYA